VTSPTSSKSIVAKFDCGAYHGGEASRCFDRTGML
jgi:hypothetical protein